MTDPHVLQTIEKMLLTIPGVEAAYVFRDKERLTVSTRVRCTEIEACNVLAYCGMASNFSVQIGEIDSRLCCESNDPTGLPCDLLFPDDSDELPTAIQRFGFFLAKTLYSKGLVDDTLLDTLERDWLVHFSRKPG